MDPIKSAAFSLDVHRLISELIRNYERCVQCCLTEYNVTVSQSYTLLTLPSDGSMSMNELSQAMRLANSTMTRMVDHLVGKELVSRVADYEDRRIVRVGLTSRGKQVQYSLKQSQQEFLQTALIEIQDDDRSSILNALDLVTRSIAKAIEVCFTDRDRQ